MFTLTQNHWKIDDVLGVWPLHGLCGAWGGIACGIFGLQALGGLGGVSFRRAAARHAGWAWPGRWSAASSSTALIKRLTIGLRLTPEEEYEGADLSIHKIGATPEREVNW